MLNISTMVFRSSVKNLSLWISGYVMPGTTVEAVQKNAKTVLFHEDMIAVSHMDCGRASW